MSDHDGWTTKNQIGGPKIISIVPAFGLEDNLSPTGYVDTILSAQTFNTREDTQEVSLCEMNHQKSPLGDRKMKSIQDLEMTTPAPPVVGTTNQQTGKQNPLNYYNYCNTVTPSCSDDVMTPDVSGTDVPASHNKKNKKNPATPSSPGMNNDDIPVASLDVGDTSRVLKSLNDDVFKTTPPHTSTTTSSTNKTEPGHTEGQDNTRGGEFMRKVLQLNTRGGLTRGGKGVCQHSRGGYCSLHGEGAIKKFRPVIKTTPGPGGKTTKTYSRKTYWECEEGATARQTQLSFCVRGEEVRSEMSVDREGRVKRLNKTFSSTTAGQ